MILDTVLRLMIFEDGCGLLMVVNVGKLLRLREVQQKRPQLFVLQPGSVPA